MTEGIKWYNNGIKSIKLKPNDPIPEGFVPGMRPRTEEERELALKRRRQNSLERYGVDSPFKLKEVQEKIKQTNLERYGTEYPSQSCVVKERTKQTNLERYGTEYPAQSQEVKDRTRNTILERYGVESLIQSSKIREKIKERYGTEYPLQSEILKDKAKQTSLQHYGTEHPLQSQQIKDRIKQTNLERYGTVYPMQSEEIKEKTKNTNLERYGVENPFQSEEIKHKMRQTSLERYNTDNPAQSEEIKQKIQKVSIERYGVPWTCMRHECRAASSNDSQPNKEFAHILEENNIMYEREFHISHFSYDFKVGNTLIEINPFPTHNILWSPFNKEQGVSVDYHQRKSNTARNAGYHCIHIFDWVSEDVVIDYIKYGKVVLNADCVINNAHAEKVLTFNNWNQRELFVRFIQDNNPSKIIVQIDPSMYPIDILFGLGFNLIKSEPPRCHWYNPKTNEHIVSEEDLSENYLPIYDCGIYTYIWERE